MASLCKEIVLNAPAEDVWDAVRDVGAIHRRLAPGVVVDTRLEGDVRLVRFANGTVLRERIVGIDDGTRRVAWTITGWVATHHHGSMQVFAEGDRCRLVWITDVLPHDLAGPLSQTQDAILTVVRRTLEQAGNRTRAG